MSVKRSRNPEPPRGKHAAHAAPQTSAVKPDRSRRSSQPKKVRRVPLALKIVLAVVFAGIIVAGALLTWNYLFRYDDAQDFQGQWKIEGSNASIVITDSEIRLTDSVSFGYELNTFEKTISYSYASFTGEGSYVFSPERDVLTITDMNTDMNTEAEEDASDQSMRLLKVSNQVVGEPETANNNDTSDAQTS